MTTHPDPIRTIDPLDTRLVALDRALHAAEISGHHNGDAGSIVSAADAYYGWLIGPQPTTGPGDDGRAVSSETLRERARTTAKDDDAPEPGASIAGHDLTPGQWATSLGAAMAASVPDRWAYDVAVTATGSHRWSLSCDGDEILWGETGTDPEPRLTRTVSQLNATAHVVVSREGVTVAYPVQSPAEEFSMRADADAIQFDPRFNPQNAAQWIAENHPTAMVAALESAWGTLGTIVNMLDIIGVSPGALADITHRLDLVLADRENPENRQFRFRALTADEFATVTELVGKGDVAGAQKIILDAIDTAADRTDPATTVIPDHMRIVGATMATHPPVGTTVEAGEQITIGVDPAASAPPIVMTFSEPQHDRPDRLAAELAAGTAAVARYAQRRPR